MIFKKFYTSYDQVDLRIRIDYCFGITFKYSEYKNNYIPTLIKVIIPNIRVHYVEIIQDQVF